MIGDSYAITFGVELELILVYHISLIGAQLHILQGREPIPRRTRPQSATATSAIVYNPYRNLVQDIGSEQRHALHENEPRLNKWAHLIPRYRSWGVLHPAGIPHGFDYSIESGDSSGPRSYKIAAGRRHTRRGRSGVSSVRAFGSEILLVAEEILRSGDQHRRKDYWNFGVESDFEFTINFTPLVKPKTFEKWHLTTDLSLAGLRRNQMHRYLTDNKQCPLPADQARPVQGTDRFREEHVGSKSSGTTFDTARDRPSRKRSLSLDLDPSDSAKRKRLEDATTRDRGLLKTPEARRDEIGRWKEQYKAAHPGERTPETPTRSIRNTDSLSTDITEVRMNEPIGEVMINEYLRDRKRLQLSLSPRAAGPLRPEHPPANSLGGADPTLLAMLIMNQPNTANKPLNRQDQLLHELKVDDWDSSGIELVSPPRDVDDDGSYRQIQELCTRLKGGPCHFHGATANECCGLHVHLKPSDGEVDLLTMKHFIYIITMYEGCIDKIMPWRRRVNYWYWCSAHVDLWSNRDTFARVDRDARELDDLISLAAGAGTPHQESLLQGCQWFPREHESEARIREAIFSRNTEEWEDMESLVHHFHRDRRDAGKYPTHDHAISLHRFLDKMSEYPSTIEFRQHEGVLRVDMIRWWTLFCAGLLRLANRMAYTEGPGKPNEDGRGYWFQAGDGDMCIWDLFEQMDFPEEGVSYFHRRAAYLAVRELADRPQFGGNGGSAGNVKDDEPDWGIIRRSLTPEPLRWPKSQIPTTATTGPFAPQGPG